MKDLHEPLEGEEARPANLDGKKWAQLNQKVVGAIKLWIDQSVYHHVANESKANVLWRKLVTIYEQPTAQNKANQLTTMKIILDDELQELLLLNYLPDSWKTLVVSVNNSAPNRKLTLDMVTKRKLQP